MKGELSLDEFSEVYDKHYRMIWQICFAYMRCTQEAEDSTQEIFIRYAKYVQKRPKAFNSADNTTKEKKIKNFLIVTAGKVCKDQLKSWWRKHESIDWNEGELDSFDEEADPALDALMQLPDKYKIPVYLYYYLNYDSSEIANIFHSQSSTINNYLSDARRVLKEDIEQRYWELGIQNEGAFRTKERINGKSFTEIISGAIEQIITDEEDKNNIYDNVMEECESNTRNRTVMQSIFMVRRLCRVCVALLLAIVLAGWCIYYY